MIDSRTEELITLAAATRILPGRPNITTVWRWRSRGVRGVKLETVLVGGRRFTSKEALERFIENSTAAGDGETPRARTNRQRKAAIAQAEKELDAAGI